MKTTQNCPTIPLKEDKERILKLIQAVRDNGGTILSNKLEEKIGLSGGTLSAVIYSAKVYGLIDNVGKKVGLTDLGKSYFETDDGIEKNEILIKAFFKVELFKRLVENLMFMPAKFGDFKKRLEEDYKINASMSGTVVSVFKTTLEGLGLTIQEAKKNSENVEPEEKEKSLDKIVIPLEKMAKQVSAANIGYLIGILDLSSEKALKINFQRILEEIDKNSTGFSELSKEVETVKKFSKGGYSNEDSLLKYAKDKFGIAFEKDLNGKLINMKALKEGEKSKLKESKSDKGESAEDKTDENQAVG